VRWMMYWIVFALYTVLETITDLTVSWKLMTTLFRPENEIDDYIVQARERSYETMGQGALTDRLRSFSMHDLTAIQGDEPMQQPFPGLPDRRKKTKISNFEASDYDYSFNQDTGEEISDKEIEGACSEDEALAQRGVRRSQSVKMTRLRARKDVCSFLI
ncbi:UNVERIFIED_CONTAM: hypothetical protein FKN15_023677, partial [Acipenser sinensis]